MRRHTENIAGRLARGQRRMLLAGTVLLLSVLFVQTSDAQPERREHERWGTLGVGKLVTKMSNTNVIGAGRATYPELAQFPAFEYPYNPDPDGRHIYYGNMVSFHVGGRSADRGPTWDGQAPDEFLAESGDQNHYRFYKGFHFEGMPAYTAQGQTSSLPMSNLPESWPAGGWPQTYPTTDPFLESLYPTYPTVYSTGMAAPQPLDLDPRTGFPGAGPNRFSPEGLYAPGQVVADQESFAVSFSKNRRDDEEEGKLMIYTTLRGLSWRSELADDMLFWVFTVTNIGTEPITDSYIGLKANLDFPWSTYQAFGTYSMSESFALDAYDVDENGNDLMIAYGWDGDGNVPGATRGAIPYLPAKLTDETPVSDVAMAGFLMLDSPEDLGITTFKAFNYSVNGMPWGVGNTVMRFYSINIANEGSPGDLDGDGIDDWTWEKPYPVTMEDLYTNGFKSAMTINTGPITIAPGETDTMVVAAVMGYTREELFANARVAHQIYTAGWSVPQPPLEPRVEVEVESGQVTLRWGSLSERDDLNEQFGRQPFEGYKIYRTSDGGQTWGLQAITDAFGTVVDYTPLAQYDRQNEITGSSPVTPTFNRGSDTGFEAIRVSNPEIREVVLEEVDMTVSDTLWYAYTDNNLVDGRTYQYAVVAYGAGDETPEGLQPLQSPRAFGAVNVKTVVPHGRAASSKEELDRVRVVPNPYRVINPLETAIREGTIAFRNVPERCTIRIYNTSGELVQTLRHDESASIASEVKWNLRSSGNREVAPGLYFFVLESELGNTSGKFVIIR